MGQRRRADPTLSCTSARRGLSIDEVAARVSFTVETTVLPSFALPRGACSGVSVSAGSWVLAPRHWSLDSRLFFGKIMDSKIIFWAEWRADARLLLRRLYERRDCCPIRQS